MNRTFKKIDLPELSIELNNLDSSTESIVLKNAIISNGIESVAFNNNISTDLINVFSHEIKSGKITSQEKSGRCWMFAGLNLFRSDTAAKLGLDDFEFSQTYPMFFDKLEKANYFLESILSTLKEDIYSRIIMWLLHDPLQDGGQWSMFANLIDKYGAVPKTVMPETFHSKNSAAMNQVLTSVLRQWAAEIREKSDEGWSLEKLRNQKEKYIPVFYRLLTYFLGEPPRNFTFEYRDKDNKFKSIPNISPVSFFKQYVNISLKDYLSIIHAPTPDKKFGKTYCINYLGNVVEGEPVHYLNLALPEFKALCIEQLKAGEPIWFGCDIRMQTEKKKGLMDTDVFHYNQALDYTINLDKTRRLNYGDSLLTHAMVLTGVNLIEGVPNRWKVENSWGEDRGEKGFFIMSDSWFDEYNYQIVINKRHVPDKIVELYQQEPVLLPPWDPFGSLAKVL